MTEPRSIVAKFTKIASCPTVYPDGAWGNLTPQGNIHMALFTQSADFPDAVTIDIDPETHRATGPEQPSTSNTVIREIQAVLVLSPGVAIAIRNWLDQQIPQAIEAQATIQDILAKMLVQPEGSKQQA
jgi:hypothetical protein